MDAVQPVMRVARAALVVVLAAVGFFVSPASPACACSCAERTEQEAFAAADAVFVGVVVDVDEPWPSVSSGDPVTVTFRVTDVYKAQLPANAAVVTARSGASCGYDFSLGDRYLVYASRDDGVWRTGLCSGNWAVGAATPAPSGGYGPGPSTPESGWPTPVLVGIGAGVVIVLAGLGLWWRRARRRPPLV